MRKLIGSLAYGAFVGAAILTLALCLGGCFYLKWGAYFQRFPNASWWTFFIPMGK